ncbi:serine/threonine-protein kinase [Saccharopolyspora rosea]|uniref:non-specific serine/threonine protein kinase n=2 Tax=Saccharopolyspora rosea TaxID=524884 RepID=A0ABW3FRN9_9PSEU
MMWQFGPYRVEALIARGGMGEIFRAYDTRHDRVVALKLLSADLAADHEFRERFKREAHAAARLREPHVIPIHAYGEIDGRLYLDMRLVEGSDLGALLTAHGPMRPSDAVHVVEQVAQALDAAHADGLVHRDIKPSNVLLGTGGFAYLVDFGIAHSVRMPSTLTSTGVTIGTLDYMAPERFDDQPVDGRADVYSLACVLYQCLTGDKPFAADTAASLINAHLNHEPPKPSGQRPELPHEFDRIVARGMAKNPADRFGTAGELARAARQALTTVAPVPAPGGTGAPRSAGRRWPVVLAGAGAVAAVAVALVVTTRMTEAGRPLPQDPGAGTAASESARTSEQPPAGRSPVLPPPVDDDPHDPPPSNPPDRTKWCQTISFEGAQRGIGCFQAYGDHLYAQDTKADGRWIRVAAETDYGPKPECRDLNSKGGMVDCDFDLSEKGKLRFQVQLWDAKQKITETPWTPFYPIGQ